MLSFDSSIRKYCAALCTYSQSKKCTIWLIAETSWLSPILTTRDTDKPGSIKNNIGQQYTLNYNNVYNIWGNQKKTIYFQQTEKQTNQSNCMPEVFKEKIIYSWWHPSPILKPISPVFWSLSFLFRTLYGRDIQSR